MQTIIHFSKKSSNVKTGKIPVTVSSENTCPDICPMKDKGCYAKTGPVSWHWNKVNQGLRGDSFNSLLIEIENIKVGSLWRHNVAGDLIHNNQVIDKTALNAIVKANQGKRGFTYTHHKTSLKANREAIKQANDNGFTINLSGNNLNHADKLKALNIAPVVTILPSDQLTSTVTPKGHKVVVCPAVTKDNVSCETCKLCAVANREVIIGFPAHGMQKKTVNEIIKG